jgi:hypothetical protein
VVGQRRRAKSHALPPWRTQTTSDNSRFPGLFGNAARAQTCRVLYRRCLTGVGRWIRRSSRSAVAKCRVVRASRPLGVSQPGAPPSLRRRCENEPILKDAARAHIAMPSAPDHKLAPRPSQDGIVAVDDVQRQPDPGVS